MRWRGWLGLGVAGLGVGAALWPVWRLEVMEGRTGRVLYEAAARTGQAFELRYVHSVERFPVTGRFRIEPDARLGVTETRFARFGAGLPDLMPGVEYERASGEFRQSDPGVVLEELAVRVHAFTHHEIRHGDVRVPLSALVPEGSLVRIRVVQRRAWEVWRARLF